MRLPSPRGTGFQSAREPSWHPRRQRLDRSWSCFNAVDQTPAPFAAPQGEGISLHRVRVRPRQRMTFR